ncbi:hypothetical protein [Pseudarthrobacter sp. LT1]|uniref:hypothetical protein n=1 Tax=Pseudarthrobacter sp. LT1 TaxID=3111450 RepID=UPI002D796E51|nr:hypothetical protein [Pseudarthrobacter sp. LT1]WRT15620.1 hypothetical protein VIK36_09155 [Pseudarthrobacter sp. LT1]
MPMSESVCVNGLGELVDASRRSWSWGNSAPAWSGVRVIGREDLGEVVGTINYGNTGMLRCYEVYFEADGLCATYAIDKVEFVEQD